MPKKNLEHRQDLRHLEQETSGSVEAGISAHLPCPTPAPASSSTPLTPHPHPTPWEESSPDSQLLMLL